LVASNKREEFTQNANSCLPIYLKHEIQECLKSACGMAGCVACDELCNVGQRKVDVVRFSNF